MVIVKMKKKVKDSLKTLIKNGEFSKAARNHSIINSIMRERWSK
jgi:hypothetical protein